MLQNYTLTGDMQKSLYPKEIFILFWNIYSSFKNRRSNPFLLQNKQLLANKIERGNYKLDNPRTLFSKLSWQSVLWSYWLVQINEENFSIKSVYLYLTTQSKLRAFATYPLT